MTHDTGTATAKQRSTAVSSAEGRLKVDMVDKIYLLDSTITPLTALLTNVGKSYDGKTWQGQGMQKRITDNPEFKLLEDKYGGRYAKVVGTYTDPLVACTITVTGAGTSPAYIFTIGDILINKRTGERMEVETVASSTTITIAAGGRSIGSTAAAQGADGDGLYIIGNASEEGATARNVNSTRSATQSNYTQIFRNTFSVTNTEKAINLYGGRDLPYQRAKKGVEHARDVERAFIFGEKGSTTGTNGHPKKYTGGVLEHLETGSGYIQDQGGAITAPDFETFLREGFTYGSTEKILFASGVILSAVSEMARGQIQMRPKETSYGMKISQWESPHGMINIVKHPFFVEDWSGYAMLLDMTSYGYRFIAGRDTSLETNVQANDADGQTDQYLTECGLERNNAPQNALLKGVIG